MCIYKDSNLLSLDPATQCAVSALLELRQECTEDYDRIEVYITSHLEPRKWCAKKSRTRQGIYATMICNINEKLDLLGYKED